METDLFQWENSLFLWQFQSQTVSHDKRVYMMTFGMYMDPALLSAALISLLWSRKVSLVEISQDFAQILSIQISMFLRWIIVISSFLVNSTSPVICHTAIGYSLVMRERFGARVSIFPFYIRYEMGSLSELRMEFPNHLIVEDFFPLNDYP